MKNSKVKNTLFSLWAILFISIAVTENTSAQITTDNGFIYFKNQSQSLRGNGNHTINFRSNHNTTARVNFHNDVNIRLGGVNGYRNSSDGSRYFGLIDADGNWSYVTKTDSYTAFKINDESKMILYKDGRLDHLGYIRTKVGRMELGGLGTGDRASYIDFHASDAGSTDYHARIRRNSGKDGSLHIRNTGTSAILLFTDNTERMRIRGNGKVIIGNVTTPTNDYKLYVEKGILTEKIRVAVKSTSDWRDYVFEEDYEVMPIADLEDYVTENKHLPNIPSAEEMVKDGLDVATIDAKLLEKIEEAYLYIIQLEKRIKALEKDAK